MARRPTESSWDSDDDLLRDDSVGISAFPADKEDELDEDALLGGSDEESEYISTLKYGAVNRGYDDGKMGVKEEDTSKDEMFELQIGDDGEEEFDDEPCVLELHSESVEHFDDAMHPASNSFDEPHAIGGMTNDTSVDVSLNTTAGTDTSVAEDNASDSGEEEEEEDDEDRGRARFKSERSSAVKPASKLRVKQDIPDTLEISEEEQRKIEEFMVHKPDGRRNWRNNRQNNFQPRFRGQGYNRAPFLNQQWPRFRGGVNCLPRQQNMMARPQRMMIPPQQQPRMLQQHHQQQQQMLLPQQQQQQRMAIPQQQQQQREQQERQQQQQRMLIQQQQQQQQREQQQRMMQQQQQQQQQNRMLQQQTIPQQPQAHKVHINPHFRRAAPQQRQPDVSRVVQASGVVTVPVMPAPMTQQLQHSVQPQHVNYQQQRGPTPQPQQAWGVPMQPQQQQQQAFTQQPVHTSPIQMQFPPQSQTNFFQHPGSRPGVPMQPTQFNEPQRMPHDLQMTSASPRPQQQLSMQPQLRQFRMPQPVSQMPVAGQRMTFRSPTKLSQGSVSRQMFVAAGSGNYGQQSMFMSQQQQSQLDSVGQPIQTLVQRKVQSSTALRSRGRQQHPPTSPTAFQQRQPFQPLAPNDSVQQPQRAAPPGGPRLQRPATPAPLSADEKKMIDRAKRFADPPTVSLKKRQADVATSVSPSPPKQVRLATGVQTAAVSAARKITTRAAAMRQQKQLPLPSQQTKQLPAAPLNTQVNSESTPKVVKEESTYEKKLAEQREVREKVRRQKEARRIANAQKRRAELEQRIAGSCNSPTDVPLTATQCDVPAMTTTPTQNAVQVSMSKMEVPKKVVKRVLMTRTQYAAMKEGRQVVSLVGAGKCENSQPTTGGRVVMPQGQPIQTTNATNRVHRQGNNDVRRFPNNRTVIAVNTGNQLVCKPTSTRTVIHAEGDVLGGGVGPQQTTRHVVDGRGEPSGGGPVMVLVDSLASATTEHKLRLLAKNIGPVQNVQLLPSQQKAIMRFFQHDHAILFVRRFNRHMLDLSMITVSLLPT